jgi:hypothetical protein
MFFFLKKIINIKLKTKILNFEKRKAIFIKMPARF